VVGRDCETMSGQIIDERGCKNECCQLNMLQRI
jgi:hypothetical protein